MNYIFAFFILAFCTMSFGITEHEAVLIAVDKNPSLKIEKISLQKDSLQFQSVKSDAGFQVLVAGTNLVELHPATQTSYTSAAGKVESTEKTLETAITGTISRQIPGGGSLSASLSGNSDKNFDSSDAAYTTTARVALSQPLLKNAWGNSNVDYAIKVGRITLSLSAEQFRQKVLDIVSNVRTAYWDWVLAAQTAAIRSTELAYAANQLDMQRNRFRVGEGTEMDTLSAALEHLRAQENLMNAEYEERSSRESLLLELNAGPLQLQTAEEPEIRLDPIPNTDSLFAIARENSSQLRVLDLTQNSLMLQYKKETNSLLPEVNIETGLNNTTYGTSFFKDDNATSARENIFDPYIGIRFSYDVLARKRRHARASASLSLASNDIDREQEIKQLQIDIRNFIDAWHQDSTKMIIRTAEVAIADKGYLQATEGFKLGTIDNLSLIKAKNDLITARLNLLTSRINLKKLEIAADKATGNTLRRFNIATQ